MKLFSNERIHRRGGFTFLDNIFAMTIVALFFGALYMLNSQCLYLLNSGRESLAATGALQDRMEQVRSCRWTQVTLSSGTNSISTLLSSAASDAAMLNKATETVTVTGYPTPTSGSAPTFSVSRNNATGVVSVAAGGSAQSAFSTYDLARIDITMAWTASPGNRSRSEQITTLWGENTR